MALKAGQTRTKKLPDGTVLRVQLHGGELKSGRKGRGKISAGKGSGEQRTGFVRQGEFMHNPSVDKSVASVKVRVTVTEPGPYASKVRAEDGSYRGNERIVGNQKIKSR